MAWTKNEPKRKGPATWQFLFQSEFLAGASTRGGFIQRMHSEPGKSTIRPMFRGWLTRPSAMSLPGKKSFAPRPRDPLTRLPCRPQRRPAPMSRSMLRLALVLVLLALAVIAAAVRFTRAIQIETFADRTTAYHRRDTSVTTASGFPSPRELHVDGQLFLDVPASAAALVVRTRLLRLAITGPARVRMVAFANQSGEEVDLLEGHATATKSYASPSPQTDTLDAGDMVMVNQTIDLLEKEHGHPAEVALWRKESAEWTMHRD